MILPANLVFYASANVPDIDTGTAGGAIDSNRRLEFTPLVATDNIEVVSSAADTRQITIDGRLADGTFVSEAITLAGTTPQTSVNVFERILRAEMSGAAISQVVTVRRATGDTLIRQIPANELGFMAIFRRNDAPGTFYQKGFWLNNHGSLTMTSAQVKEQADPVGRITFALAGSINDTGTVANRLTSPGLTFDNSDKAVPGDQLAPGDRIGVWFKLTLPGGDPDHHSTYTTHLTGHTLTNAG